MKTIARLAILACDNARARAYIDRLARCGLRPAYALIVDVPAISLVPVTANATSLFDNVTPLAKQCEKNGIPFARMAANTINHPDVVAETLRMPAEYIVYAGPGGAILAPDFFAGEKQFIHIHPGRLPEFRGSTPYYYELIMRGGMTATAMLMSPKIDEGSVIAAREFPAPQRPEMIDTELDPWMRAEILGEVAETLSATGHLPNASPQSGDAQTFFVIHTVLKTIAALKSVSRAT